MSDVEIKGKVSVDTGASAKSMNELNAAIKAAKKSLGEAKVGSEEYKLAQIQLSQAQDELSKSTAENTGKFGGLKSSLSSMPGPLGGVTSGIGKVSASLKALLLNPIVLFLTLIVGALTALYKAFASTNDGADKMEQVFAGVGAVIDVIRDRILKVGSSIVKFFSGDFKGALADGKAAVSGFGDEVAAEFQKAADATKLLQEVEDAMRDLGVSRAKLNRDLREAKELINDENASYAQKKKAIEEVKIAEGQQTDQELANAQKKLDAIKAKNALSDKSDEDFQAEADAQSALYNLQEQSAANKDRLNKQSKTIDRQEEARRKAAHDAEISRQKESIQKLKEASDARVKIIQDEANAFVAAIKKRNLERTELEDAGKRIEDEDNAREAARIAQEKIGLDNKIAYEKAMAKEILESEKSNSTAKIEVAQAEYEAKVSLLNAAGSAATAVSDLIGQQTAVGKGLAVAASTINTYAAIAGQLKAFSGIPIPGFAIAQAIATGVAGLAAVKNILKVQVPGKSTGGGTAPSINNISAPVGPTQQSTNLSQASINAVGNAAQGGINRSYITDADYTNANERNLRLSRAARLG